QTQQPQQQGQPKICDHCRRRQIKCVAAQGATQCSHCESKGLKCTYTESPSNPILKRNMGVIQEDQQSNKRPRPSSVFSISQQQQQFKKHQQNPVLQYPRSSFFVGSSSSYDSSLLDKIKLDKIDQVQLSRTLSLRKVSSNVQFILRDDFTDLLAQEAERQVDEVESLVTPHGMALIHLYFKVIHPAFPILHKKVFLEKYARSYREFSAPLLATVYSLACKWWDFDPMLAQHQRPNIDALNEIAIRTFSEVTERPRLSAVQAGLLLLQCRSESSTNWILCQQVVSLAEELGLGLDCHDWKLPKWERGLRRRLAWAVWIQEKWTALTESRVSHFTLGRNWIVRNIANEDFPELPQVKMNTMTPDEYNKMLSEHEVGKNLFKGTIELSMILSEILENFYTYSFTHSSVATEQVLKQAKPLQLKLRQWYQSLPQNLQMTPVSNDRLCPVAGLHLQYFITEITLHRKIILALSSEDSPELIKVCRAAATTRLVAVLEFMKNLKTEHIKSFWHSSTCINFSIVGTFAAILYATSSTPQESNMYRDYANNFKVLLQNIGRFFIPARAAAQKVDMLLSQIPGLLRD
ncbi:Dal81p CYBJADRAFT_115289, partial [Cyberlindnera jadinii NRRL Y-1542]